MPPAASRSCPCTTPSPTTATSSRSLGDHPACGGDRLLVSGSGLRPARQAPPGQPGPPRGQGRHHQPGPGPGLVDPPPPGQHRPGHRPPLRRPGRRRPRRRPGHPGAWPPPMACRARGRWSAPVGVAGTTTWPRPASATPARPGWTHVDWRGRGGYVVAPPSRHASGHPYQWAAGRDLDTPPGQVPRCCCERLQPRHRQRPTGPVQLPAVADGPGDRYARAALAEELARVATAPVGQRNRQLWESTRNLYNLVATGALDHREVDQGLLAAAERCGLLDRGAPPDPPDPGLGPPGRPGPPRPPRQPTSPERTHASPTPPLGRPASEPRRGR